MKKKGMAVRVTIGMALILYCLSATSAHALTMGAAAGYKRMMEKVLRVYEQKTGQKVEQVYGHMGQVIMQAKTGSGMGVIIGERSFLKSSGLEISGFSAIGRGILVLAYSRNLVLESPEDLLKPHIRKIATPDPKQAIYGKAAVEFLQNSGLGGKVHSKIITVATIPQISSYLVSGDIDAGFINKTDAMFIRDKIGGWVEIDKALYSPIHLTIGIMKGFENNPEVRQFQDFLTTDRDALEIMSNAGMR